MGGVASRRNTTGPDFPEWDDAPTAMADDPVDAADKSADAVNKLDAMIDGPAPPGRSQGDLDSGSLGLTGEIDSRERDTWPGTTR